jgi:ferredoxin
VALAWQIRWDPIRCGAHGYCAEILPERITLDDWGFPVVSTEPIGSELEELARRAVAQCPLLALKLERRSDRH